MSRFLVMLFAVLWLGIVAAPLRAAEGEKAESAEENSESPSSPSLVPLEEVFQQRRSCCQDLVFFRNDDVLRGTILNENLTLITPYGECIMPVARCAGIAINEEDSEYESIITTNANTLRGLFRDRVLKFRIESSGTTIEIRKEKIKKVVFRRRADELAYLEPIRSTHLFVMNNGDLLTGTLGEKELTLQTEYADFPVPLEDIQKIEMRRGEESSVVLTMMNEDHVRGTLTMETLSLRLDVGAGIDSVYKDEFDTIHLHDGLRELTYKKGVGNSVFRPENVSVINEIGMELIYIPAGTFMMGSPESEEGRDGDEGPVHKVTLTDPFYMGKYEVTQSQYEEVMRRNPSKYVDEDLPVEQVSWYYARIFCTRLSASDEQFDYRLPTEAEWEYACRAGTRSPFYWGDIWDDEYG